MTHRRRPELPPGVEPPTTQSAPNGHVAAAVLPAHLPARETTWPRLRSTSMGGGAPSEAAPDTPLLYVLTDELALKGRGSAAAWPNAAPVRCWSTGSRPVPASRPSRPSASKAGDHARGPAGLAQGRAAARSTPRRPAPGAAGHGRRAGHPVRLLLQRHDHQGRRTAVAERPDPTEAQIRQAMNGHLCRCGTYPRGSRGHPAGGQGHARVDGRSRRASILPRALLKAGGALVVGFTLAGRALRPSPGSGPAARRPDVKEVDTWLAIHEDNTVTLYLGFVELGQGTTTALPQVAAEELDIGLDQIRLVPARDQRHARTRAAPISSASIARGSPQVRAAAAEARAALLQARRRQARRAGRISSQVSRGVVSVTARRRRRSAMASWSAASGCSSTVTGKATVKSPDQYQLVGTGAAAPRPAGQGPGRLRLHPARQAAGHAARPRGAAARAAGLWRGRQGAGGRRGLDRRDGREGRAPQATSSAWSPSASGTRSRPPAMLKVTWDDAPTLPPFDQLHARMQSGPTQDHVVLQRGDAAKALRPARPDRDPDRLRPLPGPRALRAQLRPGRGQGGRRAW